MFSLRTIANLGYWYGTNRTDRKIDRNERRSSSNSSTGRRTDSLSDAGWETDCTRLSCITDGTPRVCLCGTTTTTTTRGQRRRHGPRIPSAGRVSSAEKFMERFGAVHRTVCLEWGGHYGTVEVMVHELDKTRKQLEKEEEVDDNNTVCIERKNSTKIRRRRTTQHTRPNVNNK